MIEKLFFFFFYPLLLQSGDLLRRALNELNMVEDILKL